MTLRPSAAGTGIVFRRIDLPGKPEIAARYDRVADTTLCTQIAEGEVRVGTVEHLMAAFSALGVDNVVVELDGPEVPVMDGSAQPFVFLIECAQLLEQTMARTYIRVLKPVEVEHGNKAVRLMPAERFGVSVEIDFDSQAIARQTCGVLVDAGAFRRELAKARTFGFADQVEQLRALGLIRGGSLDNAVVVQGDKVLNEGGLRYEDEFVRHKALDAIGDLALAGAPILGHYVGVRAGHALNNALLLALFEDAEAWTATHVEDRVIGARAPLPVGRLAAAPY